MISPRLFTTNSTRTYLHTLHYPSIIHNWKPFTFRHPCRKRFAFLHDKTIGLLSPRTDRGNIVTSAYRRSKNHRDGRGGIKLVRECMQIEM